MRDRIADSVNVLHPYLRSFLISQASNTHTDIHQSNPEIECDIEPIRNGDFSIGAMLLHTPTTSNKH